MRKHLAKFVLIGIVVQFSGCVRWPYRSVEVTEDLDARQAVALWVEAAQLGDVGALKELIAKSPASYGVYCVDSRADEEEKILVDKKVETIGISPEEAQYIKELRANRDLEGPYSGLDINNIADHLMINSGIDTSIGIKEQLTYGDESAVWVRKTSFETIHIDFNFLLVRRDFGWRVFEVIPFDQDYPYGGGRHFAQPRPICGKNADLPLQQLTHPPK